MLAAFAYGALRTGSLLHAVVLLTPLVPLLAYAVTTRSDNTEGITTLVAVGAVAVGLMLLGSIQVASNSVWIALDRLADAQGLVRPRPARTRGQVLLRRATIGLRRVGAVLVVCLTALALAAVCAVAALTVWWLTDPNRIVWVQDNHRFLWLLALAAIAASGWAAHRGGRQLQVLTRRQDGPPSRRLTYAPVVDPGAIAAGWAVVYGTAYLGAAWVISLESLDQANPWWRRVAFATTLVFAAVLLLLPPLLTLRALAAAARREVTRGAAMPPGPPLPEAERRRGVAEDMIARGTAHRRFVTHDGGQARLTAPGARLDQRALDARAGVALRAAWDAPPDPDADDVEALRAVLDDWQRGAGASISTRPARALAHLVELLDREPEPRTVRHAVDRLLASLRRSRGR